MNAATRDETAQSPDDYVVFSSVVSWANGETGCKLIPITVKVDDRSEPIESLWVELSNAVGAGLGMDKARFYIADVQAPAPPPAAAAPVPTTRSDSNRGGGGAAGSGLFDAVGACLRRRRTQRLVHGIESRTRTSVCDSVRARDRRASAGPCADLGCRN